MKKRLEGLPPLEGRAPRPPCGGGLVGVKEGLLHHEVRA